MLFCNPRVTKIEMAVKRQIPAFVARTLAIRRFDRKAHNVAGRKYNTTTATNTNAKNGRDTTNASTIYKTPAITAVIIVEARSSCLPGSAIRENTLTRLMKSDPISRIDRNHALHKYGGMGCPAV